MSDVPPGWRSNPSAWEQRLPLVGLALVGLAIASYLSAFQVGLLAHVWEPFFGDGSRRILTSGVSRVLPVPDAALGAFGYLLDAATGLIGGRDRWRSMPWIVILFGVAVGPLGATSILLVILQPVLFDAFCTLCLASAVVSVAMIGPALDEVLASLQYLRRQHDAGRSLWAAFWGRPQQPVGDALPRSAPATAAPAQDRRETFVIAALLAGAATGVWLVAAPGLLGLPPAARLSHLIVGPVAAALAVVAISAVARSLARANIVSGAWLVVAPLLIDHGGWGWESAAAGLVLLLSAVVPRPRGNEFGGGWTSLLPHHAVAAPPTTNPAEPTQTRHPTQPTTTVRPKEVSMRPVVVVTGASAGVGRAAVRAFAEAGWDVGLIARGRDGLEGAAREVEAAGGRALVLPLDVADAEAVESAAGRVEAELGQIETWVNNAMVSVFSPIKEMEAAEYRRVTEVTYLGYVHGTLSALRRMLPRDRGVIVQVGSALAYRSIPLQSAYCAAKHAMAGFTESLRTELLHDGSNVEVVAVHMPALNTPQFDWVKSRLPNRAQPVPPIFEPEVAAEAIVHAATHPRREYLVGRSTVMAVWGDRLAPGILDHYLASGGYEAQQTDEPEDPNRPDNLWQPVAGDHGARGRFADRAADFSPQLWATTHRPAVLGIAAMLGLVAATAGLAIRSR